MAGARPIVDSPAFASLPHGLWESVQHPTPPAHWQQGVTWIERCARGDTTYDECISVTGTGAPPEPPVKTDNVLQEFRGATPVTVYAEFECSPVGIGDALNAATDALSRVEATRLEEVFWTGVSGAQNVVFPHLAADAEVLDADSILLQTEASVCITGVDVAHALGALENCLADCHSGQGLVHVPPEALPTLYAWNLVLERDGALFTPAGHRLVVGTGYTGSGPDGAAPPDGSTWIYATGPMFGYRGEVFFTRDRDSFDRAENTMRMIAERTYVLGWECCHFAALINLGVPS